MGYALQSLHWCESKDDWFCNGIIGRSVRLSTDKRTDILLKASEMKSSHQSCSWRKDPNW